MPPAASRESLVRRAIPLLVVALFAVAISACGSASAKEQASDAVAVTVTEVSTTTTVAPTTTTMKRAVAGSQLSPGTNSIYVLGDSVTLGAEVQLSAALSSWKMTYDEKESRRIDQGVDLVGSRAAPIARVLVVHLCTNWGGGDFHAAAVKLMAAAKNVERVVWVTCVPWLPAVGAADAVIKALPDEYPNVVVADWAAVAGTPGYTYDDQLHLKTPGAEALAALIAATAGPAPLPG